MRVISVLLVIAMIPSTAYSRMYACNGEMVIGFIKNEQGDWGPVSGTVKSIYTIEISDQMDPKGFRKTIVESPQNISDRFNCDRGIKDGALVCEDAGHFMFNEETGRFLITRIQGYTREWPHTNPHMEVGNCVQIKK